MYIYIYSKEEAGGGGRGDFFPCCSGLISFFFMSCHAVPYNTNSNAAAAAA